MLNVVGCGAYTLLMPTVDNVLLLVLLAGAAVLFVTEKLRPDVIALSVWALLLASGLLPPGDALYGFANSATAVIASMFVISAGLVRTGLVDWLARRMDRWAGESNVRLLLVLCLTTAALSMFIVNSAIVAAFIPIAVILTERRKIPVSRILIPMAFASQLGGVCTLVGSSTNILMNSIAVEHRLGPFAMFEFASLGGVIVAVGILYLVLLAGKLLPRRASQYQKIDKYRLSDFLGEFTIPPKAKLTGKRWKELKDRAAEDIQIIKLIRRNKAVWRPSRTILRADDVLLVYGDAKKLLRFKDTFRLQTKADIKIDDKAMSAADRRLIEAVVPPRSSLVDRTLESSEFKRRFGGLVLAVQRRGRVLRQRLHSIRLQGGDALLLQCDSEEIGRIKQSQDLIMTEEWSALQLRKSHAVISLGLLGLFIALAAFQILPVLTAAVLGAVGMIVTGCLTAEEAYRAIDWSVIFLLGGILPLGLAMQESGTAAWLADTILSPLTDFGPYAALAAFYVLTALFTEGMSNMAAAVLLAPIALSTAAALGISPRPLLVAITFAASTSFATPIGYQTNTMIYAPGGYRFTDFTRVGLPLNVIFGIVSTLLIPLFWPF